MVPQPEPSIQGRGDHVSHKVSWLNQWTVCCSLNPAPLSLVVGSWHWRMCPWAPALAPTLSTTARSGLFPGHGGGDSLVPAAQKVPWPRD